MLVNYDMDVVGGKKRVVISIDFLIRKILNLISILLYKKNL